MDKLFIKKFKMLFAGIGAVAFLSFILLVGIVALAIGEARDRKDIQVQEEKLKSYQDVFGTEPDKTLKNKRDIARRLQEKDVQLMKIFTYEDSGKFVSITPLNFKQKLFDVEDALRSRALKLNVALPKSLGFEEFKSSVPTEMQTLALTKELYICEEIINLLLDSKVNAVTEISFPSRNKQTADALGVKQNALFEEFLIQISLEADFENAKKMLAAFIKNSKVYIADKLDIKNKNENGSDKDLVIDLALKYVGKN
ncbi:MAG: Amuc_1100 family pilus-like protein [Candidatus Omnitrophica bacterium]|nr:Amuc_1100 family pilus-like protein [Candidatus Omnitrophota bacterium]MBU1926066.1 Amuc_1100 family pilus-like protein [Candidatus Omnitrophota bacterium]